MACTHCRNGWLDCGDTECVNGVLIDIDVAHEGWQRDVCYPPAPCEACAKCGGSGRRGRGNCRACKGSGWRSGSDESQERLMEWSAPDAEWDAAVDEARRLDGRDGA